jgi:hypothetical protein
VPFPLPIACAQKKYIKVFKHLPAKSSYKKAMEVLEKRRKSAF